MWSTWSGEAAILGPMIFQKLSNHFDRKAEGEVMRRRGWVMIVMGKQMRDMERSISGIEYDFKRRIGETIVTATVESGGAYLETGSRGFEDITA
jgi:hypothetical protein